ncbi:MAG: hypothetical protein AB7E51_08490 [Pseudodesulfovibrio sp.]|uniref:hypothetical protein n=1 Tax=Pseudodesulfovibrio sp. TaxID=2035812 RepID=UPI003D139A73
MPRKRHKALDTLQGIRDEMLRLYQSAKAGKIDPKELGKFIYALNTVAQITKDVDVVDRLDRLEEAQAELGDEPA